MRVNVNQFVSIAAILIFILGYVFYFDLKNKLNLLHQVNNKEIDLRSRFYYEKNFIQNNRMIQIKLLDVKKNLSSYFRFDTKSNVTSEFLTAIIKTAELNGLELLSINPEGWKREVLTDALTIHLVAFGSFVQFVDFLSQLNHQPLPIVVSSFSLQIKINEQGQINIHLMGFYLPEAQNKIQPQLKPMFENRESAAINKRNPFGSAMNHSFEITNQLKSFYHLLDGVSLRQIKWVGFIREGSTFRALAMLPNGKTLEIKVGALIGAEKGKVVAINEHHIILNLSGKEIIVGLSSFPIL